MKTAALPTAGVILAALAGCGPLPDPPPNPPPGAAAKGGAADATPIEVIGHTQCAPGRKGIIAPVPLHPVVEVLAKPGDRVKKGQPLVKLDDDEPQADVRAKQAALESARVAAEEARRVAQRLEELNRSGALAEGTLHAARAARLRAEADERAAKAALESAKAELEHYVVEAAIDGVVSWLDVYPGTVSRPGTTVWGEILDLSEIDVRCDVTPDQADRLAAGQAAEVRAAGKDARAGRVAWVGIAADRQTGTVPVVVRLPNADGSLRCEVAVRVRFAAGR